MLGYVILTAIFNIIAHANKSLHEYIKEKGFQTSKWWLLLLITPFIAGTIETAITLKPPVSAALVGWTVIIFFDYCNAAVKEKVMKDKRIANVYKDLATLILTLYAIPTRILQEIGLMERRC
tara:strand:+ start:55 stop:420 length:366 start_codon:yes stop_codon:yes gene_type:complete